MFVYLFGAIVELALWVGGIYLVYRVVFSKSIAEKKKAKARKIELERLVYLTLKASKPDKVDEFLKANIKDLSKEDFDKLTEHLEYLNVLSDEPLKARFDTLEKNQATINEIHLDDPTPSPTEVLKNPPKLYG